MGGKKKGGRFWSDVGGENGVVGGEGDFQSDHGFSTAKGRSIPLNGCVVRGGLNATRREPPLGFVMGGDRANNMGGDDRCVLKKGADTN